MIYERNSAAYPKSEYAENIKTANCANIVAINQKKNLDVWVAECLTHTKRCTLFKRLFVLRDLLVCQLGHEFKTWLDLLDWLGLKASCCHCLAPDRISDLGPDKDGAPSIRAADRSGGDITEVGNIVKTDVAAGLFVFVGYLEWQLDYLSTLAVNPELTLADLHLLDGFHLHGCMVFHELENTLVREVLHAEYTDCECNAGSDITGTDRVELEFPDCLHLAGGSNNTDLVQAKAAGCFLDHGHIRADIVLGACCCKQFSPGVNDRRNWSPGLDHIPV